MKRSYNYQGARGAGYVTKLALGIGMAVLARKLYRHCTKKSVKDKVVLITGGSRGLGLAVAKELANRGADIIICARTAEQLEKAGRELIAAGARVFTIVTDLRDPQQVTEMMQQSIARFGRIDILVNNAGVMVVGPENVMEIDDYKEVMNANLWSSLHTIKAAMPYFKQQGGGHIVIICSVGGKIAVPHMLPYSISKFALVGLSQGLASELAKEHIKVTTVIPNLMRTGSPRNISLKGDHESEYAWFKIADSLPVISQSAAAAARQIAKGIEAGQTEITLTFIARLAVALQGIFPSLIATATRMANYLLPEGTNREYKKGYQSESKLTKGVIGQITDRNAVKYNQL